MKKGEVYSERAVVDDSMLCLKWMDKRAVTLLSTLHDDTMADVQRPSRGARGGVEYIQKPQMIDECNKHMGVVDLSDQLVLKYGYSHRQIKWWKRVFFHLIDLALVNSNIMYNSVNKQQLTQMEFRIAVAKGLLEGHTWQQAQHYNIAPQLPTPLTEHPFIERIPNDTPYSSRCEVCRAQGKKRSQTQYRCKGTNPVTMKNYGSGPMGSSTLRPSSELCVDDKPFDGLTFVKEANYTEFTKRLHEIGQYSLSDILDFSGSSKTDKGEVQAAFGIANLFHDINTRAVLDNKAKLVGVVCPNHDIIVVPEHNMFATTRLQPWLSSTTDIAVYPYSSVEQVDVSHVQETNIPFFLAQYYSKDILATAKQCAIKLIRLLQLNGLHGCTEKIVIGFALPQILSGATLNEVKEENVVQAEELVSAVNKLSRKTSNKKKTVISKSHLNAVVQVTVEWNFEALRFVIMYTVLEKENVVTAIENVLKKQREQMNGLFRMKHNPSKFITLSENELDKFKRNVVQLLAETWESEKTKLRSMYVPEAHLESVLRSCSFVNWEVDSTTIEQYNSSISLVFKLSNTLDGSSLFLKSFSRTNMRSHLAIIEHHLTKYHVQCSLCSSYFVLLSSGAYFTAFHVFRGLHHITRETAKECLIDFLQSVKAAVDELHSHDMAHLDIHLPNICLRNTPDEQLDYLQVFWMAFWILLSPDEVDYHQMHEINFGQEYEDILNFIKVFNSEIWNDKETLEGFHGKDKDHGFFRTT
ncbi:hypothetical protein EMCRGX_G008917 [Ephydatia muelleri]